MSLFTRVAGGRLAGWLTVAAAIVIAAAVFGLPRPTNPAPVSSTGLSAGWQSTVAERLQRQLPTTDVEPAIIVVSRADGAALSQADRATVTDRSTGLARFAAGGRSAPPQVSPDGTVALVVVPISTAGGDQRVVQTVDQLRAYLADLPPALTAQVTGAPAFTADLTKVFDRMSLSWRSPPALSRCCS